MKTILSFGAGVATTTGLIYSARMDWGLIFAFAFLLGLVYGGMLIWLLYSRFTPTSTRHHIHRVVEKVNVPIPMPVVTIPNTKVDWAKEVPAWTSPQPDVTSDVVSALCNQGMKKKQAVEVVKGRVKPGMSFEEAFKSCLS